MIVISIYRNMLSERERLEKKLKIIQEKICLLPDGKLICVHNGNRIKWFHSDGHTQTYIFKEQREYVEQLAIKRYLQKQEDYYKKEIGALNFYLRHSPGEHSKAGKMLTEDSVYRELLEPYFQPFSQELSSWANASYDKNKKYSERLIHKTCKDEYVRSKSEALIAMALYVNKIPYRYECELKIGEVMLYPDFTIRHPESGKFFYWEHFGMMDVPEYVKTATDKILLYAQNGIFPDNQLITTYETKDHPLDMKIVENLISYHFGIA